MIDAYALAFAALLLPAGIAADRVGRKTLLIIGLLIFGGAGLASAYAPDPETFIALRAVAGAGAAGVFPVTLSALVDAYPEERRSFAVAVWSGISAAGAVAGTIVAGLLLEAFTWGSIQILFGGLALLLVVPAAALVAQHRTPGLSLDPLGAVLSLVGLSALVYGIISAPERGWTDPVTIGVIALGLAALIAFGVHETRTRYPSLDVRLFRNRGLAVGSMLVSVQFFASLGLFVLAPQYLQIVRDLTPLQSALALLVIPVGVGAGTGVGPKLLDRFGARVPGAAGLGAMAVGFTVLALALVDGVAGWVALTVGLVLFGLGFGLGVTPGTVLILEGLPPERRSVASAVNDITREVGGVLGIAVLSSVLVSGYRRAVEPDLGGLPDPIRDAVMDSPVGGLAAAGPLGEAGAGVVAAVRDAFSTGTGLAMAVGAGVLAVAAAVCAVAGPSARTPVPEVAAPEEQRA